MSKVLKQAEKDLDALLKIGAAKDAELGVMWQYAKAIMKPLLGSLAAAGAMGGVGYYLSKKNREQHEKDLIGSMQSLVSKNPDFIKTNPEKFIERFGELTMISPTIAKNPTLASKIVGNKLNSGFDVDDIHKLTSIEANAGRSGAPSPGAAARASASHALQTIVQTFGRDFLHDFRTDTAKYHAGMTEVANQKAMEKRKMDEAIVDRMLKNMGHIKQSSAKRVSDECLGEMLAERYVMFKTAGVGDALAGGAKALGSSLVHFAPALALGGGIELVRHVLENRRIDALEQQADRNFKTIMRDSDTLKGSPETAMEAFNTLKAVAPSLAARPLVAKTFIEYVSSQGRLAPETVQQLAEAENQVRGIGSVRGNFMKDLQSTMTFTKGFAEPKTMKDLQGGPRKLRKGFLG